MWPLGKAWRWFLSGPMRSCHTSCISSVGDPQDPVSTSAGAQQGHTGTMPQPGPGSLLPKLSPAAVRAQGQTPGDRRPESDKVIVSNTTQQFQRFISLNVYYTI